MLRADKLIAIALCVSAGAIAATPGAAQQWPTQPVRIVVGFGPGSTPDLMARTVANHLSMRLGKPFVIENKAGAGGNLGVAEVAKATPDGLTLGVTIPGPLVVNPMTSQLPYDPKADIAPITIIGTQPAVLVASTKLDVSTLAELITKLKQNPGKYNYASIGIGSISHIAMESVSLASGTTMVHLPYKGSPEAVAALISGDAQIAALPPISVMEQARAGMLRMLAVSMPKRWPLLPDVPTFAEAGLPDVQAEAWGALIAPARTPKPIIDQIFNEVKAVLATPEVQEQMKKLLFEPVGNSPEEFAAVLRDEEARWSKVIDKAGLRKK
jgi:tripartite-type tricarboxylate transporter receptor subunit TctC